MENIAILGAGNVGGNLGIRLAKTGYPVRFGVRPSTNVNELLTRCEGKADATSVAEAARWGDVILLALPANAVVSVIREAGDLEGKILVDCNNPVDWKSDGPALAPVPEGSLTAALAQAAPGARVVKAFNVFGAEFHLDPSVAGTAVDVPIAGDDAQAKEIVAQIAKKAGFSTLDAGPLRNAALLESFAVLWIHLALKGGHGRHVAWKLLSRGGGGGGGGGGG